MPYQLPATISMPGSNSEQRVATAILPPAAPFLTESTLDRGISGVIRKTPETVQIPQSGPPRRQGRRTRELGGGPGRAADPSAGAAPYFRTGYSPCVRADDWQLCTLSFRGSPDPGGLGLSLEMVARSRGGRRTPRPARLISRQIAGGTSASYRNCCASRHADRSRSAGT